MSGRRIAVDDLDANPNTPLAELAHRYLADDEEKRCPYPLLKELRDAGPIVRSSGGAWLILGSELARSVLRDQRFSRARAVDETLPSFLDPGPAREIWTSKIANTDGERHRRLRQLVSKAFTPKVVERWRPVVEAHAKEILDEVTPRHAMDAVAEFAYPLPQHVICALMGVPVADHGLFQRWATTMTNRSVTGPGRDDARAAAATAILEFTDYLSDVIGRHEPAADGDLISQLAYIEADGSRLSAHELKTVAMELITAGHDTTANVITIGILELSRRPDLFEATAAGEVAIPEFVDEVLRARSPVQLSLSRVATEALTLEDETIEAGDVVMVSLASVNRDPALFPDSDAFDPARPAAGKSMAFGDGEHSCLGRHLARVEAEVALGALVQRLPGLHLTVTEDEIPWRAGSLVVAPSRLPVGW